MFKSSKFAIEARGVATGRGIYTSPPKKNQSTLHIFMWLLVVFLFDPGQIVVDFQIGIYPPPPNEIPGYAPDRSKLSFIYNYATRCNFKRES